MSDVAIRVENISKRYTIGNTSSGSLRETIAGLFSKNSSDNTEEFYALHDVSFEVKRGEAMGIIGKNGAGKSTLLKVLSRITEPTTGRIEIDGRVSSLLEVGTGFHPELTGRENVFLNGTILGMTRAEVKRKFDEIVDFSGVEKFLDTPVKRYSSGMKVRLAFAVAAHLEPEILIIDEVLAVGDAEFQRRCLGKMEDITGEGRTVLFVSHSMASVRMLCTSCILLNKGQIALRGSTNDTITEYLNTNYKEVRGFDVNLLSHPNRTSHANLLTNFAIKSPEQIIYPGAQLAFLINYNFRTPINNPQFCILLYNKNDVLVFSFISDYQNSDIPGCLQGTGRIVCTSKNLNIMPGSYYITLKLWVPGEKLDEVERAVTFSVEHKELENTKGVKYNDSLGVVYFSSSWQHKEMS